MVIKFKNGSLIETLETNGEIKRREMSKYIQFLRRNPSEYIYLATGKRLPLWRRIWVDKICPLIKR